MYECSNKKRKKIEIKDEITGRCNVCIVAHLDAYFYISFCCQFQASDFSKTKKIYFCVLHIFISTYKHNCFIIRMSLIPNNKCFCFYLIISNTVIFVDFYCNFRYKMQIAHENKYYK